MRKSIRCSIVLLLLTSAPPVIANDPKVETVLTSLGRPTSVAVRPGGAPERYEVFLADSGARRIIKISSNEPSRSSEAITGFLAAWAPGADATADSPSGLLFLDEKHLVVGVAGAPPEVRLYQLAEAAPPSADQAKQKVALEPPGGNPERHFGVCTGITRTRANDYVPDMLLIAFIGAEPVRGVWKLPVRANVLGRLTPLENKPGQNVSQPTALTVNEQGYLLAIDDASRSIKNGLMFLNPTNGQPVLSFQPELSEIRGVAYSPKSGNLYALATLYGTDEEGLFRLDDAREPGEQQITIKKLADINRPAALAFGPDGTLYLTTLGDKSEIDGGALLKVTGDL